MNRYFRVSGGGGRDFLQEGPHGLLRGTMTRNHDGPIFDADGNQLGTMRFEIRTPEPGAAPKPKAKPKLDLSKPGDFAAYLIKKLTGKSDDKATDADDIGCSCRKIRMEMNEHGWMWCFANRDTLIRRIADSAKKKGVNIDPDNVWTAFQSAWSGRRKDTT